MLLRRGNKKGLSAFFILESDYRYIQYLLLFLLTHLDIQFAQLFIVYFTWCLR